MNTSDAEIFAEDEHRSADLRVDLSRRLELLTSSHRSFAIRAAQELYRAERYRQYLSLIIVRGDRTDVSGSTGSNDDVTGSLTDLATMVRGECRISDLVSGVEDGLFAVLLVETGPEGAEKFLARLSKTVTLFFAPGDNGTGPMPLPVDVITFPDQGSNAVSMGESLENLYRQSIVRH